MESREFEWITTIGIGNVIAGIMIATGYVFFFRVPKLLDMRIVDKRITLTEFRRKPYYRFWGIVVVFFGLLLFFVTTYVYPILAVL